MNIIEELKNLRAAIDRIRSIPNGDISLERLMTHIDTLIMVYVGQLIPFERSAEEEYCNPGSAPVDTTETLEDMFRYPPPAGISVGGIVNGKVFGEVLAMSGSASPLWGKGEIEGEE